MHFISVSRLSALANCHEYFLFLDQTVYEYSAVHLSCYNPLINQNGGRTISISVSFFPKLVCVLKRMSNFLGRYIFRTTNTLFGQLLLDKTKIYKFIRFYDKIFKLKKLFTNIKFLTILWAYRYTRKDQFILKIEFSSQNACTRIIV